MSSVFVIRPKEALRLVAGEGPVVLIASAPCAGLSLCLFLVSSFKLVVVDPAAGEFIGSIRSWNSGAG